MRKRYDALRAAVIERDGGVCQDCGGVGTCVHHVISRRYEGAWAERNMLTLCEACHLRAHTKRARRRHLEMLERLHGYEYSDGLWRAARQWQR